MNVVPAVDILQGKCVQLKGGDPATRLHEEEDPVARAKAFAAAGARLLHVVDLDAAFGSGDNADAVHDIVEGVGVPVQVGGGVRSEERLDVLLERGAERVVVGTRAVLDPDWLAEVAEERPRRIVLALDCAKGRVVVKGWREGTPLTLAAAVARVADLPLAGILTTNVDKEGRLGGPDVAGIADLVKRTPHPVLAAGGIASMKDLEALARAGASAAIVGAALYKGKIDLAEALARFGGAKP